MHDPGQQPCPKCEGQMERGFVMDHLLSAIGHWAPGAAKKSYIRGTKRPETALPFGAFRCSSCGYVELYAREEFAIE